jgi:ankyrin repeat protein
MVKALVQHDGNINKVDSYLRPPLHWAIMNSQFETAKVLLDAGARSSILDCENWSALDYCAESHLVVQLLLPDTAEQKNSPLPNYASKCRTYRLIIDAATRLVFHHEKTRIASWRYSLTELYILSRELVVALFKLGKASVDSSRLAKT